MISFTLRQLYPQGKDLATHLVKGWVGPIFDLEVMEKRKISLEHRI
jgi:hypothetical protein